MDHDPQCSPALRKLRMMLNSIIISAVQLISLFQLYIISSEKALSGTSFHWEQENLMYVIYCLKEMRALLIFAEQKPEI